VVLPTPIPDKGKVLTQLSLFWFEKLHGIVPNHIITATDFTGELAPFAAELAGRSMLVKRTEPIPIECVVRGYLSGSGWKDYQKTGRVCGIPLAAGVLYPAFGILLSPIIAALAMALSSVSVIGNALRLRSMRL